MTPNVDFGLKVNIFSPPETEGYAFFYEMQQKKGARQMLSTLKVEAAGFEPASREVSAKASTCVVVNLNFA